MKKFVILLEGLIIASPIIAWRFGSISLTRLGEIMVAFGALGSALIVLSNLNLRLPVGDISLHMTLTEIGALERAEAKPSLVFILQMLVLVVSPLTIAILIRLFS